MQQFDRRTWLCAGNISVRQKESCKITKKFAEAGEKAESKPENNYERIEREIPAAANRRKFCKNSGEAQKAQKSSRILRNSETASGLGKWHSACQKPRQTTAAKTPRCRESLPGRPRPEAPRNLAAAAASSTGIRRPRGDDPIRRARPSRGTNPIRRAEARRKMLRD